MPWQLTYVILFTHKQNLTFSALHAIFNNAKTNYKYSTFLETKHMTNMGTRFKMHILAFIVTQMHFPGKYLSRYHLLVLKQKRKFEMAINMS